MSVRRLTVRPRKIKGRGLEGMGATWQDQRHIVISYESTINSIMKTYDWSQKSSPDSLFVCPRKINCNLYLVRCPKNLSTLQTVTQQYWFLLRAICLSWLFMSTELYRSVSLYRSILSIFIQKCPFEAEVKGICLWTEFIAPLRGKAPASSETCW